LPLRSSRNDDGALIDCGNGSQSGGATAQLRRQPTVSLL
jgi:hypothetical protein